jgi:hypothetical protein
MRNFQSSISIDYLEGSFSESELNELKEILESSQFSLTTSSHEPINIGGIEELFPQIKMLVSPDIVNAIILGLVTSGAYDTLKTTLMFIYHKIRAKQFWKISPSKKMKSIPTVHFIMDSTHVILPMELDNEKFEYFVDSFFESLDKKELSTCRYIRYAEDTRELEYLSESQMAEKLFKEENAESVSCEEFNLL